MPERSPPSAPVRWSTQIVRLLACSLVCAVALAAKVGAPRQAHMASAAAAFLASLPRDQRELATFEFEDPARVDWHFIPRKRPGLALGGLSEAARGAARDLIASGLSERGLQRVDGVIELEGILRELESTPERPATWRDPGAFFLSVFGQPGGEAPWAWRLEGHHISLNFSVIAGRVAVTPGFVGSNPAHVAEGPRAGWRLLGAEEDAARALVQSLSTEQVDQAVVSKKAPDDIFYGPERTARVDGPPGLSAELMDEDQRRMLEELVDLYLETLAPGLVEEARARLGPPEQLRFTWMGGTQPGQAHYWRIDGAHALIEWDDVQNGANHVHTVWRDLERDFGLDLLGRHRREQHADER